MNPQKKQLLDSIFSNSVSISDDAYKYLDNCFHEKEYSAREIIVEGGGQAKYFYLIFSGVQAIYIIDEKGEKVILGFSFSGNASGVYDSFLTKKSSRLFMEAITASKMIAINYHDYLDLFRRFPEFYEWRTHFIEHILFGRISREVELMTLPAKERFDAFIKRCPQELLDIPQKYLASYLNMKPETLAA